jgi:hypothetical protein
MPSLVGYEDDETTFTYCLEVENGGEASQQGRRFESLTYTCEDCDNDDGEVGMVDNDEGECDGDGDGEDTNGEDDGDDGDDEEERPDGNRARYKRRRFAVSARRRGGTDRGVGRNPYNLFSVSTHRTCVEEAKLTEVCSGTRLYAKLAHRCKRLEGLCRATLSAPRIADTIQQVHVGVGSGSGRQGAMRSVASGTRSLLLHYAGLC